MTDNLQSLYFGATEKVIAPQGNAYFNHCPGLEACPHERHEEERLHRFEQATGISCCKGARLVLQKLIDDGNFDRKQLALAWRTRSLVWDWDLGRMVANVSRLEMAYGVAMVIFGAAASIVFALAMILGTPPSSIGDAVKLSLVVIVSFGIMPFAEKFLVRPNRIARRAKPHIERYYASDGPSAKEAS